MTNIDEIVKNLGIIENNLQSIIKKVPLIADTEQIRKAEQENRLVKQVRNLREEVEALNKTMENLDKKDHEKVKIVSKRVIEIFKQKKMIEEELKKLREQEK